MVAHSHSRWLSSMNQVYSDDRFCWHPEKQNQRIWKVRPVHLPNDSIRFNEDSLKKLQGEEMSEQCRQPQIYFLLLSTTAAASNRNKININEKRSRMASLLTSRLEGQINSCVECYYPSNNAPRLKVESRYGNSGKLFS